MNLNRHSLREIRERTGVSTSQLAKLADVDRTLIHRLENGERNASPVVIRRLADALKCPLLALINDETADVA